MPVANTQRGKETAANNVHLIRFLFCSMRDVN